MLSFDNRRPKLNASISQLTQCLAGPQNATWPVKVPFKSICLLAVLLHSPNASFGFPDAIEIRVGIVAYQKWEEEQEKYEQTFRELQELSRSRLDMPEVKFTLAVGTYAEILHWMREGYIDAAIATPGVYGEIIRLQRTDPRLRLRKIEYVGTRVKAPELSIWVEKHRRTGEQLYYRSVCVVHKDSRLREFSDIITSLKRGDPLTVLFVDPLSTSGYIVPCSILRKQDVHLRPEQETFTYSHTASLEKLAEEPAAGAAEYVAFVWDGAPNASQWNERERVMKSVRKIGVKALEEWKIPEDVLIATSDYAEILKNLLALYPGKQQNKAAENRKNAFKNDESLKRSYIALSDALKRVSDPRAGTSSRVTLDNIGWLLRQYAESSPPRPLRLALVLSGGGAKCAYQVGAIGEIEKHLAWKRQETKNSDLKKGLNIALVVGTSGGAINALPVALGVTRTDQGRSDLAEFWRGLDQRDIVNLPWLSRFLIGMCFATAVGLFSLKLARRCWSDARRRQLVLAVWFAVLAMSSVLVNVVPWPWFTHQHLLHHAILVLLQGLWFSIFVWVFLAAWLLTVRFSTRGAKVHVTAGRWFQKSVTIAACLAGILFIGNAVFLEETLLTSDGFDEALGGDYIALIWAQAQRIGKAIEPLPADVDHSAQALSEQIVKSPNLIQRDLVITGSALYSQSAGSSDDLYFYFKKRSGEGPSYGEQGIRLNDHPRLLLDVIAGSGSIFPVFPPRMVQGLPGKSRPVAIVDGGFAHNSPVEAAVRWGATHIIVIEASPSEPRKTGRSLFVNVGTAFGHLYEQAQQTDLRSKGEVVIFTLAPERYHLRLLDFARNLIDVAIEAGKADASGKTAAPGAQATFRKELGRPLLVPLT